MPEKKTLKNIHIFASKQEDGERIKRELKRCCAGGIKILDSNEMGHNLKAESHTLYLTDIAQVASALTTSGYPVLAYLHGQNRNAHFADVRYAIEGFEDVDADYFERVFLRLTGQPWHILDTLRCRVRESMVEDLEAFYDIYAEPAITRHMENLYPDREKEETYIRDYIQKVYGFYGFGTWTVLWKETGEVIGRAGLEIRPGFQEPELGFVIGVPWQGKGIGYEVTRAILKFGHEELEFEEIQALVESENTVSINLCKKLKMEECGEVMLEGRPYIRMKSRRTGNQ